MDQAYSLKALGDAIVAEAKKDGLTLAEESVEVLAKAAYNGLKGWINESSKLSSNKIDDIVAPFLVEFDKYVVPQIEKIDLDGDGK